MLTPLWQDPTLPSFPPVPTDAEFDVAVVGGGIAGMLTALLLARSGRSVGLLEARRLGTGTTGRTTAKCSLLQGTRLSRIRARQGRRAVAAYVEANTEGQAWLRQYLSSGDVPFQVLPAWTHATTPGGERRARVELTAAQDVGLPVGWDDDPGLPFENLGAVRLDDQLQLDPRSFIAHLVQDLVGHGVALHEQTRVTGLSVDPDGVRLEVAGGSVRASRAVIATGMPFPDRGGYFARCRPERSYAAVFRSDWEAPGMYLSADTSTRSLRSVPDGYGSLLMVGGNGHITGRAGSPAQKLDELLAWARDKLPVGAPDFTWSAQDPTPVDLLPCAGSLVPGDDRVLVAAGFGKWGFSNAPAAALSLAARLLGGDAPSWASALDPWGKRLARGLPSEAKLNVEVAGRLAEGWSRKLLGRTDGAPVCTHLGGVLAWNDAEESWDCPLHGSRFDADGAVLEGPAVRDLEL